MIELQISPNINCHVKLKEKLVEMSLARNVIESPETNISILKEGSETYTGCDRINAFLTQFESFKEQWYECTCDKYEQLGD